MAAHERALPTPTVAAKGRAMRSCGTPVAVVAVAESMGGKAHRRPTSSSSAVESGVPCETDATLTVMPGPVSQAMIGVRREQCLDLRHRTSWHDHANLREAERFPGDPSLACSGVEDMTVARTSRGLCARDGQVLPAECSLA